MGVVKIHCDECIKDFGGNTGDHSNYSISNLFANFQKHHSHTNAHIRSLCRQQGLPYTNHPQSIAPREKSVIPSYADHKHLVYEGTDIMDNVNNTTEEVKGEKPFYIVGNTTSEGFKFWSYWFKVHCRLCGDFF